MDEHDQHDQKEQILLLNQRKLPAFLECPVEERILFLSHCINKPKRAEIKAFAEELGYRVMIVGGGSIVRKRIESEKPGAVVGIACYDELVMAAEKIDIPFQIVLLDSDGCENTDFNLETAQRVLRQISVPAREPEEPSAQA